MAETRKGCQTPTRSVILPYSETRGQEAIDLYNSTVRTAQPWQELIIYELEAVNDEGLWVHTKFGYSVPRWCGQNQPGGSRVFRSRKPQNTHRHRGQWK